MKRLFLPLLLLLVGACASTEQQDVTTQDERGNYVTSSDYRSMERSKFIDAMRAGLDDYDKSVRALRLRANELGGESLEEFADCSENLQEKRKEFVNQLGRMEAALAEDWPEQREQTIDVFFALRAELDEAYDEVLDT